MAHDPRRALWTAVLGAALDDVAKGKDTGWIGTRDFHIVCAFAGLDAEAVASRFEAERYRRHRRAA